MASLAPFILDYLRALHGAVRVQVSEFRKSSTTNEHFDRFTLHVPYCETNILLDIYFDVKLPDVPPDILLIQDEDLFFNYSTLQAIQNWQELGTRAFYQLVFEILLLYEQHFHTIVQTVKNNTINFEYSMIQNIAGVKYYARSEKSNNYKKDRTTSDQVRFLIPIEVGGYTTLRRNIRLEEQIQLLVTFHLRTVYNQSSLENVSTSVIIPENAKQWIGTLQTQKWIIGSTCLIELIPAIQDTIESILEKTYLRTDRRRDFIRALSQTFGSPVEFDSHHFEHADFLMSIATDGLPFLFLIHVTIPQNFPEGMPIVQLTSTQHLKNNKLVKMKLQGFSYDPKWEYSQMVDQIAERLQIVDVQFYEQCRTLK
jgi:hypothetical protein